MSPVSNFFAASKVLIVAGKGGVGKSTVCASLGVAAAKHGCDVLLVEVEGYSGLGPLLGVGALSYEETLVESEILGKKSTGGKGQLRARQIMADSALFDYIDHSDMGAAVKRLTKTGAIEMVATAAPGIRDLLALGKIRQLEQIGDADLIIVDAPSAGHALTFLAAPAALAQSSPGGPIKEQADAVLAMLGDESRCRVMLVTTPEETPVNELVETAFSIEETVDVKLAPVVVNSLWPSIPGLVDALGVDQQGKKKVTTKKDKALMAAASYRLDRVAAQKTEVDRLQEELPLDQIGLPFLFTTDLDLDRIGELADHLVSVLENGELS